MSTWITVVGILFVSLAAWVRMARKDERAGELAQLDRDKRTAYFWWSGTRDARRQQAIEDARQAIADKVKEHRNWRNNLKFELGNWTAVAIGLAILLFAAAIWMNEDPAHTWGRLWKSAQDDVAYLALGAVGIYYLYQLLKRLDKADNEIKWLSGMLDTLKNHTEANHTTLQYQIDSLKENRVG
jgi:hypothetical protein